MAPNDVTPCDKKQTNQHTVETLSIQCYGWIESWLLGLYPWCFLNFVVLFDLTDFLVVSVFQLRAGLLRGRQMLWGPAICREPGRVGNNAISCSITHLLLWMLCRRQRGPTSTEDGWGVCWRYIDVFNALKSLTRRKGHSFFTFDVCIFNFSETLGKDFLK